MLSEGRMLRASLRHRAFDPWPRAAQPWTTQDADAMWSGKTSAYLLKKHTGRSAAEWAPCVSRPSGLSDQRPPGAEGPPEEKELRATSL